MIAFGCVTYTDFGPFAETSFRFDRPGVTLVDGLVQGVPSATNNGAGKTMLLEGLVWCLYGRCLRDAYKGDDVIRHGARWASVGVEVLGLDHPTTIVRYRGHPKYKSTVRVLVDGADTSRGRNVQTQEEIDALIGLDYATFTSTVAFGARQDVRSFFSLPEADRKAVFEDLLGLGVYSRAEELARQGAREAAQQIAGAEAQVEALERRRGDLERLRAALPDRAALERVQEASQAAVSTATTVAQTAAGRAQQAQQALADSLSDYRVALAAHRRQESVAEQGREKATKEVARCHSVTLAAAGKVKTHEEARDKALRQRGSRCPTCQTVLTAEVQATLLAALAKAEAEARPAAQKAQADEDTAQAALTVANAQWAEVKRQAPEPPDTTDYQQAVEAATDGVRRADAALRQAAADLAVVKSRLSEAARMAGEVSRLEAQVAQEGEAATDRMEALRRTKAVAEFWVKGFGDGGLKSYLIETALPQINAQATALAQRLIRAGAYVRLTATKTLKSGETRERMEVEGFIPGMAANYAAASKGQRLRLDLALLLAFREVAASRAWKQLRQFLADELFDGLDRSGCDTVAEILRDLSRDAPVVLVTHDDRLKGWADRRVVVEHNGDPDDPRAVVVEPSVGSTGAKKTSQRNKL